MAPLVAAILLGSGAAAAAATLDDLYQAKAIVTGQEQLDRRRGVALCLKEVLVKVSGDPRLAADPRVAEVTARAGTFVDTFRYRDRMSEKPINDEQGTRDRPYDLTVKFNPSKIDSALRSLGRAPWTALRPRLAVFVVVNNGATTYALASDARRGVD
ncbi:MAG: DUF2066 domain-containing protein, partial [Alphaproteobacteria bacterium]